MRGRAAALAAAALVSAAAVIDAVAPAHPGVLEAAVVPTRAGVISCPIATIGRGRAYLHLANIGETEASVRITLFPSRGKRVLVGETLPARSARSISIHNRVEGSASALIEHSGGTVVASHSLWVPPERGLASGGAAGACAPSSATQVAVAPLRTLGTESVLTLFNPGAADAVVSVQLLTAERRAAPERLTRRIVRAHRRLNLNLGAFAFDEPEVIALVDASSGRVVPEALVYSVSRGMELVGAQTPSDELTLAFREGGRGSSISIGVSGEEDTGVMSRQLGPSGPVGQEVSQTLTYTRLVRGSGARGKGPEAFRLRRVGGAPIVAGASFLYARSTGVDLAGLEGLAPFTHWAATLGSVAEISSSALLIVNPGTEAVTPTVVVGGRGGTRTLTPSVAAQSVLGLGIGKGVGTYWVDVAADLGITVALVQTARSRTAGSPRVAYFDVPAFPLRPPLPVAALPHPGAGIPAAVPVG